ncbi:hypothetical protein KBY82_14390 [Cyanobium sp. AMD-g]|uniref:hypothetical protein n=1 Tax=Cyanobium sp. AMD-g TaxID=2823699 RepID=UPI0020CE9E82|nr:hypothetical protein [Cyanobium sp. AMD-g]MCP9931968.1 hypothetical protein [Cyanobium sp. AMD-g]
MTIRLMVSLGVAAVLVASTPAQAQSPVVSLMAKKVAERYQKSTCDQLWAARSERRGSQEQRVFEMLSDEPQMRQAFFDQIAGPVMNKLFICGMIP